MTDTGPLHWSQRGYAGFLLAMTFVLGVFAGLMLANAGEFQRLVRQSERTVQEAQRVIDQRAQQPTLHERLDVIEQRLEAIEQRLTP